MRLRVLAGIALLAVSAVPSEAARRRSVAPPEVTLAADFAVSGTVAQPGEAIRFEDASTGGAQAWSWNFGDGATSPERSPTHGAAAPGSYLGQWTVRRASSQASKERSVEVRPDVTGKWTGRTASGAAVTWELAQQGIAITGASTFMYAGYQGTGPVSGSSAGATLTFRNEYVMNDRRQCRGVVEGTLVVSVASMSGTYILQDCEGLANGTLMLRRE